MQKRNYDTTDWLESKVRHALSIFLYIHLVAYKIIYAQACECN